MIDYFLTQASLPEFNEYVEEIKSIWDNHWVTTMGPKHEMFERHISEYMNAGDATLFVNGHNALEAVIAAYELKGEIITTPFSFISTTHAIVRNGIKPVFCDIKENDFNIDVDKIEELITSKTSAIVPVHMFGTPCEVERIEEIANKYNLKVIYDAAHAFGVEINGVNIAAYGDASIFSFHASKVFNCIEGGCVICKHKDISTYLRKYRNFGNSPSGCEVIGTNGKMNEFMAAMGLCNLRHIDTSIEKRRCIYERYLEKIGDVSGITIPEVSVNIKRNYAYLPIVIPAQIRDRVFEDLNKDGIQALRHFYPIIPKQPCYRDFFAFNVDSIAEKISKEILLLPLYENLSLEEVDYISNLTLEKIQCYNI